MVDSPKNKEIKLNKKKALNNKDTSLNESNSYESNVNTGLLNMALEDKELMYELELEKKAKEEGKKNFVQRIKELRTGSIVKLCLFIFCIIFLFLMQLCNRGIKNKLIDQNASDRWSTDGDACAVSVFLEYQSPDKNISQSETENNQIGISVADINSLRYTFKTKLDEVLDNKKSDDLNEDDNIAKNVSDEDYDILGIKYESPELEGPYTYAYSARGLATVASGLDDNHIINDANIYGVGGDFFIFHPINLLSGGYFDDSDVLDDGVILDVNSAFRLFGSSDIIGQMVTIGGVAHYVRGVYAPSDSHLSRVAGSDGGFIFMHYSSLKANGRVGAIDCLEFATIEPYKGFTKTFFNDKQNTGFSEGKFEVVQNSDRFGVESLFSNVIANWNLRSMQTTNIVYPYWENIARAYEGIAAFILIIQAVCILTNIVIIMTTFNNLLKSNYFERIHKIIKDKLYDLKVKNKVNAWKYF